MTSVTLRPGVDVEKTFSLNEAGISQSQLIRTKNGLTQSYGGWVQIGMTVPSTVRDLHAWQDTLADDWLAAAATQNFIVQQISSGTGISYQDIMPTTRLSSATPPNVSTSSGSNIVTIIEPSAGLSILDTVEFLTPISVSNLLLQGSYPVLNATSTGSFTIVSSEVAATTVVSSGILPIFSTTANSNFVGVEQPNHTALALLGRQVPYYVPTSVGGITIEGPYSISAVTDSTTYTIISPTAATAPAIVTMNNGNAQYLYYNTPAPVTGAMGWGGGPWGGGAWGSGATPLADPGSPITATDWTSDNWGEIILACPEDGGVYQWSPTTSYSNMQIIPEAPLRNGGIFVSMPQQLLVCWKSEQGTGVGFNPGGTQDNLIVRWSDAQDFTSWDVSDQTAAGSFHIPTGSVIRGGLQAPNYGVIWTDIDAWIMSFTGDPVSVFNFTKAGSGCGLIGSHAAGLLGGNVFWCSERNFFTLSGQGAQPIPCTVWDFFFQQVNNAARHKVVAAPNSAFNEMSWHFPLGDATENTHYVKVNVIDNTWDFGQLPRTAWTDVSVIGMPVGADTGSTLNQHEIGNMISGAGNSFFRTGWWSIADGQDLGFVDWVLPDFIWGTYGTSTGSVQLRFFSVDYVGDTPRTYGPYTVTQANQYISLRLRGRYMAMEVVAATNNVFFRLGRIQLRVAMSGRR